MYSPENPDKSTGMWCCECGQAMRFNVPRLGPDGGYVHDHNNSANCQLLDVIEHYFDTASREKIEADLKACEFEKRNKIGPQVLL